jgi:phage repressor protein C with HTH and peptisase S24 domain
MEPLLGDGDEILVDQDDAAGRLRDGVYVLRREGALMVKRLSPHPGGQRVSVSSDNPAYPSWPDCDAAGVDVVGRVIWAGKRIR